jgi:hypothetical protein
LGLLALLFPLSLLGPPVSRPLLPLPSSTGSSVSALSLPTSPLRGYLLAVFLPHSLLWGSFSTCALLVGLLPIRPRLAFLRWSLLPLLSFLRTWLTGSSSLVWLQLPLFGDAVFL